MKVSPRKCFFPAGKWDFCHYNVEESHVFKLQRVGSHDSIVHTIKTVKRIRTTSGGDSWPVGSVIITGLGVWKNLCCLENKWGTGAQI